MGDSTEARFARKLASNDGKTRTRALKSLKKWMTARSAVEDAFTELEMLKLWKGLYMCMWHSDKPLVQEELAENLASFVHVLQRRETVLQFVRSFFSIMTREWLSIDRLRLDKFYMLIRRMLRHSFQYLLDNQWDSSLVESLVQLLSEGPLNPDLSKTCSGIQLHVVEVYLPELLGVGAGSIPADCSLCLLQPCCHLLANTRDPVTAEVVEKSVLSQLVVGKKAEKLQVDVCAVSERLLQLAVSRDTIGRNRKTLYTLRKKLQEFAAEKDKPENGIESEGQEEPERDEEGEHMAVEAEEEEEEEEEHHVKRKKTGSRKKKVKKRHVPEDAAAVEGEDEARESIPRRVKRKKTGSSVGQKKKRQEPVEGVMAVEGGEEEATHRVKRKKREDSSISVKKGLHSDLQTPSRPKKRVSFSLHKNTVLLTS